MNILSIASVPTWQERLESGPHIFLEAAVISREALIMRSLRSWCSSSSAQNRSKSGMKGDVEEFPVPVWLCMVVCDRLVPITCTLLPAVLVYCCQSEPGCETLRPLCCVVRSRLGISTSRWTLRVAFHQCTISAFHNTAGLVTDSLR